MREPAVALVAEWVPERPHTHRRSRSRGQQAGRVVPAEAPTVLRLLASPAPALRGNGLCSERSAETLLPERNPSVPVSRYGCRGGTASNSKVEIMGLS